MERQKEIKIGTKKYLISFHTMGEPYKEGKDTWICAYVTLKGKKVEEATSQLQYCTYHDKDVFGIDTAHFHNWKMTLEEKQQDAELQIKELIKSWNKIKNK